MNKRQLIHVALLFLPLLATYIIVFLLFHDLYLAIIAGYLVLLVCLQFVALGDFLLFSDLQELWRVQSECVKQFVLDGAEFQPPIIKVTPKIVLSDANLYNIAKLKYLVGETGTFIPGMRDEFKKLIFLNLFLLIALIIITPPKNVGSQQAIGNTERSGVRAVQADSGSTTSITGGQVTGESPAPSVSSEDLIRTQGKLAISYFAVVLQLVWVGRVAFHYRQKNADLYFQATAT
jgi:hypothetical protein